MGTQKKYDPEFKLQVVKDALSPENKHAKRLIAKKYGIDFTTLYHWLKQYQQYGEDGLKGKRQTELQDQKIKDLEKENKDLKEEIAILKKAAAFLAEVGRK